MASSFRLQATGLKLGACSLMPSIALDFEYGIWNIELIYAR